MRLKDYVVLFLDVLTWVSIIEIFKHQSQGNHAAALCFIISGAVTLASSRILEDKFLD